MPLANGEVFAGYRILQLLGAGGMGEVYLAQHPRLPRRDALKILPVEMSANREFRDRFNREADLVATLYHPHIIGVHDRGETAGQLWISMDYIDGPDAGRLMRERYPDGIPRDIVVDIVFAVSDALDYAHQRGLLHRDIKPANILLTDPAAGNRRILLADFGIARNINENNGLTATNTVLGTVTYAAPEQLTGQPLDGRADQYALAATAYELLSGTPLFADSNPAVVIGRHLNTPPPPLGTWRPDLADLDPVLARALATNPSDPYGPCTGFARAIANPPVAASRGAQPVAPTRQMPAVPPAPPAAAYPADRAVAESGGGMSRGWIAAGTLAAIMLLVLVAFVLRPWKGGEGGESAVSPTTTAVSSTTTTVTTGTATTTAATTTTSTSAITFDAMHDLVLAVYGALPASPMDAWAKLDPHYQNRAGLRDFLGFWSSAQSVSVLSVTPRDATSVVVRLRYVMNDGRADTEDRWLSTVLVDGKLRVYDSERIGPA